MSNTPLSNPIEELHAKIDAQGLLLCLIVGHIVNVSPGFPSVVIEALENQSPLYPADDQPANLEQALRVRERARNILLADMEAWFPAKRPDNPPGSANQQGDND